MHICIWDGEYATVTELLLLVVPGAVVLTAPGTVSNICRSVDNDYLALMKGCIYEFSQYIQDKRVVISEKKFKCASWSYFTNVFIFCWYFGKHFMTFLIIYLTDE